MESKVKSSFDDPASKGSELIRRWSAVGLDVVKSAARSGVGSYSVECSATKGPETDLSVVAGEVARPWVSIDADSSLSRSLCSRSHLYLAGF